MSSRENASPKVWMDAYLAAFAKVSNLQFVTADAGFQQSPDLDLLLVL
jgi:predicted nucleic acid-binding protein